jgi:hypothetical protein
MIYAHVSNFAENKGYYEQSANPYTMQGVSEPNSTAKTTPPPNGYYDAGGITVLNVMKAKLTPEQFKGYLLGNVIKYSLRLNFKGSSSQDIQKLADYADWLAEVESK